MMEFYYSNANGEERYTDNVCIERFANGAWTFRDPDECRKH